MPLPGDARKCEAMALAEDNNADGVEVAAPRRRLMRWRWRVSLALLILAGLVGGVAQMLLTEALRAAPIGVVAPFDYTQLVWAALLGLLLWGELPHPATIVGSVIVAASGVYILHRELRRFRAAAAG